MSILSILISSVILLPAAGLSSVNVFPPGAKPYGLTYAHHINYFRGIFMNVGIDSMESKFCYQSKGTHFISSLAVKKIELLFYQ